MSNEIQYTHFRFGVGCHDKNGFWYSNFLLTYDDPFVMAEQWDKWKRLSKHFDIDELDNREMLIDQYDAERRNLYDTIVIPSKYADDIQRLIFAERYEEIKFDIWKVAPLTVAELNEIILQSPDEIPLI